MTTTWQILDTKSQITNGLITKVIYACMVQLENDMDRKIGEVTLIGNINNPNYISFEALTEEIIVGWVKSSLGETQVQAIEIELQDIVEACKVAREAETEKSGLPWRQ